MSTIKTSNIQNGSSSSVNIALNTDGSATFAQMPVGPSYFAMRNKIINGAMEIDQRNSGASFSVTGGVQFIMDRFFQYNNYGATYTCQRINNDAPAGFIYAAQTSFSSTITPASTGDGPHFSQWIEGFNIIDLAWGTPSAKPVTVSFWVKSGITGLHGFGLCTVYGSPQQTIGYPATYTINVANTWEYKTITIPGPTSGTWDNSNGPGILARWYFASGSNFQAPPGSWQIRTGSYTAANSIYGYMPNTAQNVAQSGNVFKITGIQIEAGSVATPFERRLYNQELSMCQRYCEVLSDSTLSTSDGNIAIGSSNGAGTNFQFTTFWKTTKRANPTISLASASNFYCHLPGQFRVTCSSVSAVSGTPFSAHFNGVIGSNAFTSAGQFCFVAPSSNIPIITASAEL